MRPTERSQAIAFLLSLGAIPLGCPAEEDDDTGASSNPSGSNSNATTSATTDSAGTDSAGTDSDASDTNPNPTFPTASDPSNPSDPSDPSDPTDATLTTTPTTDPDTGYGTYGSSGGYAQCRLDAVPAVCTMQAAHIVKCQPKYAMYEDYFAELCGCAVSYYAPMYGAGCATAYEEYYACIAATPCEQLGKDACAAEGMAADAACGGGGGSEGG